MLVRELGDQLAATLGVGHQPAPEIVHPGQLGVELLGQRLVQAQGLLEQRLLLSLAALVSTPFLAR